MLKKRLVHFRKKDDIMRKKDYLDKPKQSSGRVLKPALQQDNDPKHTLKVVGK